MVLQPVLKRLMALWFGGLRQAFLADIGLEAFSGIGEIVDKTTGTAVSSDIQPKPVTDGGEKPDQKPIVLEPPKPRPPVDAATKII